MRHDLRRNHHTLASWTITNTESESEELDPSPHYSYDSSGTPVTRAVRDAGHAGPSGDFETYIDASFQNKAETLY